GLVNAVAAVAATGQTAGAAADPVSSGFASEMYPYLYGQPLTWRDLAFNGGVDANGVPWSEVTWTNISWDPITWQNVSWEVFNWAAVTWQDISWEGVTWEDISWEALGLKSKDKLRKAKPAWGALN